MNNIIYCVIGVEYNSCGLPIKICLINSFLNIDEALLCRDNSKQYTNVDIVETSIKNKISDLQTDMEL